MKFCTARNVSGLHSSSNRQLANPDGAAEGIEADNIAVQDVELAQTCGRLVIKT